MAEKTKKKTTKKKSTAKKAAVKKPKYKYLVIVESPAKSKTLEKYLGKDYKVVASMGHLRDLPKSRLAVDLENNFEPYYCIVKGKAKYVKQLKEYAAVAEKVFLAPDPDREGEAIAWHLCSALELKPDNYERIEFNEITKKAVLGSLDKARDINLDRVNAQQARRILDRLVGYKLSPLLWKRVKRGLSAGRVQSAALNIICRREDEIDVFVPEEYWAVDVAYQKLGQQFKAKVVNKLERVQDFKIANGLEAAAIEQAISTNPNKLIEVVKKERRRKPAAPFTTSTLQQEASRRLGFNARRTMMIAQQLYEGIDLGGEDGQVGLITYMRTDSTRISDDAMSELRSFISSSLGSDYLSESINIFKQKGSAQDAHEAIRPTEVTREPKQVEQLLSVDQFKLYKLIWRRFVSAQMANAVYDQTRADFAVGDWLARANGSIIKFNGFLAVYEERTDLENSEENENNLLPELIEGEVFEPLNVDKQQKFTQPPPRYTEASLVKTLEELGIGRPSTYAPIISTIQYRNYIQREAKALIPTELGRIVDRQIRKHFPEIVDVNFTADMENRLDEVAEGRQNWREMLSVFYVPFEKDLVKAETEMEDMRVPDRETDEVCELCGKPMVIKSGRFGDFMACSGFPDCKNTKSIPKIINGVSCPKCGGEITEKRSKAGRTFYGCTNYPECNFACWDKPTKENCEVCGSFLVEKGKNRDKLCIKCDLNLSERNGQNKDDSSSDEAAAKIA